MHYLHVKKNIPSAQLMYTDTDSLIYYSPISREDFIVKMQDILDLSNLPKLAKNLGIDPMKNKMRPGWLKIEPIDAENPESPIKEFYARAPKMYEVISETRKCSRTNHIITYSELGWFRIDNILMIFIYSEKNIYRSGPIRIIVNKSVFKQ
jgi:hypothetical protein